MLAVRAISKHKDANGILVGYTIQDVNTGSKMQVYKDALKDAVRKGQCEVVNMTLTSDGRFIGKAAPLPKKRVNRAPQKSGVKILQMFTCGKEVLCAMVDITEHNQMSGTTQPELKGLKPGTAFIMGEEVMKNLNNKAYDNIVLGEDGKIDAKASGISKNSFSKIRSRLLKIIRDNNVESKIAMRRAGKDDFSIQIENYDALMNAGLQTVVNMYRSLIIYAIKNGTKNKVSKIDGNLIIFYGPDNMTEARKILKAITEEK